MSRDSDLAVMLASQAAASAATTYLYYPVPTDFRFEGYAWSYQTAEANTDNTLDFLIEYDSAEDGTFATALHTNANAVGLLNSSAIGEWNVNFGNAASGGGAAVAAVPTAARVAANQSIRVTVITAGTGTVPGINFAIMGKWLQPMV